VTKPSTSALFSYVAERPAVLEVDPAKERGSNNFMLLFASECGSEFYRLYQASTDQRCLSMQYRRPYHESGEVLTKGNPTVILTPLSNAIILRGIKPLVVVHGIPTISNSPYKPCEIRRRQDMDRRPECPCPGRLRPRERSQVFPHCRRSLLRQSVG